jgi:hypothetical protein
MLSSSFSFWLFAYLLALNLVCDLLTGSDSFEKIQVEAFSPPGDGA